MIELCSIQIAKVIYYRIASTESAAHWRCGPAVKNKAILKEVFGKTLTTTWRADSQKKIDQLLR
jgi:hypothetical protein